MRADYEHADELVRHLGSGQLLDQIGVTGWGESLANRRMNRLFMLRLPFDAFDMHVKVVADSPAYGLGRRFNLMVNRLFSDYGKRGFEGTLLLEAIGIPTIRAIAYWTYRRSRWRFDSYFLYQREPADMTVLEFRRAVEQGTLPRALSGLVPRMHKKMAQITRSLHDAGFQHGDIVEHNFLVTFSTPPMDENAPFELHLVDNDHVRRGLPPIPLLKQMHDMRCLRRLRLDPNGSGRVFLREYLGNAYNVFWLAVYRYYNSEWRRPIRNLRHRLRGFD